MERQGVLSPVHPGSVAIVEPPVSQWYARRAWVTALVLGLTSDALMTAVLSVFCPLLLAVVLGALTGVVCAFVTTVLVRVWPVLRTLWWWSIEIATTVVTAGGWVALAHLTTWWIASAVLLAAVTAVLGPGRIRHRVWAWSWCLIARHRLRVCFASLVRGAARVGARPVALPLVLWAKPTLAGERVWLWLRPGLELADLEGKAGLIAVACWVKQIRVVSASERYAALIRVDVGRRDPLTGRIESPLSLLIPSLRNKVADAPVSPGMPPVGLELADIDEPAIPQPRGGRR